VEKKIETLRGFWGWNIKIDTYGSKLETKNLKFNPFFRMKKNKLSEN